MTNRESQDKGEAKKSRISQSEATGEMSPHEQNRQRINCYQIASLREKLFSEHSKHRTYFDSADLALASAHRESDLCTMRPGAHHPVREDISLPYCAVPSGSNVGKYANDRAYCAANADFVRGKSHLR
ncbi:hypothetical protein BDV29DRAFT_171209 [Aspergillus leporis]|uniref:Uncharacterized protein n=1 Tax=Aspergillus leporis TaxID=41062 RepID=A0A5N5X553_9EURO|nr:hypothetical protein BDV29DRAFT_171209 [Aspergillus leporis]